MPRRNRVDPWGDLHTDPARGLFTGNRGCVVDEKENVVRHHGSSLWITCKLVFRDWKSPLARGRRWTPLFFLDDAVALAAGHRPCAFCRRDEYKAYRDGLTKGLKRSNPILAAEINRRLVRERHRSGRGLVRAQDRLLWTAPYRDLPNGAIVCLENKQTYMLRDNALLRFSFRGWGKPIDLPNNTEASVLTPPTSILALRNGFAPLMHPSAEAFD